MNTTPPRCRDCGQPSKWRRYGRCALCCGYRPMAKKDCLHCCNYRAIQARGLCNTCLRKPHIRSQYPAKHRGGRSVGDKPADFMRPAPLPPEPTTALPGSAEKIAVMMRRVACGLQPCHPQDAKGDHR